MAQAVYEGFILSRQQYNQHGKLQLCYWLKTEQGAVKVMVEGEQAIFFIRESDAARAQALLAQHAVPTEYKPVALKHYDDEQMLGCYFDSSADLYRAKEALSGLVSLYEDDVRHCDRFLMERYIRGSVWVQGYAQRKDNYTVIKQAKLKQHNNYKPTLKMLSLDIECDGNGVLFSVGLLTEQDEYVIMIGEPQVGPGYIIWVEDELALLQQLMQMMKQLDPDVIIGWNIIEFDCVVLAERAKALNVPLILGRDDQEMHIYSGNYVRVLISGRVVIDGIDTLKNATYHFPSFRLSEVANSVLGESKLLEQDDRLSEIVRQFNEDKRSLAAYNLQDCKLVLRIFNTLSLLDFAIVRTQLTGLELERMGGSVAAFTNLYLPLLHRSGYVAPNLGEHKQTFESPGGYVMDSKPGLYKNVLVLDFKSLYPSIIRTFHIDPLALIKGLQNTSNALEGFHGAYFSKTDHHLPELVAQLAQARQEAKAAGDKMLSQAIKIIMNSLYGVLGSKGCRFSDPRLSSSITLRGHEIMQQTKAWLEVRGYEVIYGDTDSTFVKLADSLSAKECQEIGQQLEVQVNELWSSFCEQQFGIKSYLEIEFETHYSPFFMPTIRGQEMGSKKRYVGQVYRNGEPQLVFKGMETVRSDWTDIAKRFQQELIKALFNEQDTNAITQKYIDLIYSQEEEEALIYVKRLGKPVEQYTKNIPPHVRAAKEAIESGLISQGKRGVRVHYYMTISGPKLWQKSATMQNIDYDHYIQKQIFPIVKMLPNVDETTEIHSVQGQFKF